MERGGFGLEGLEDGRFLNVIWMDFGMDMFGSIV